MPRQTAEYRPKKPKEIPIHPNMVKVIKAFHRIWYPNGHPGCEYCETKK